MIRVLPNKRTEHEVSIASMYCPKCNESLWVEFKLEPIYVEHKKKKRK